MSWVVILYLRMFPLESCLPNMGIWILFLSLSWTKMAVCDPALPLNLSAWAFHLKQLKCGIAFHQGKRQQLLERCWPCSWQWGPVTWAVPAISPQSHPLISLGMLECCHVPCKELHFCSSSIWWTLLYPREPNRQLVQKEEDPEITVRQKHSGKLNCKPWILLPVW